MKPQRRIARQFHIAALEVEGIVLDIMPDGNPNDPHREHRERPVVQVLGARRLHLLDGVPLSEPIDPLDKVTLARDVIERVEAGKEPQPRGFRRPSRGHMFYLSCLPGYTESKEKAMFCYIVEGPSGSAELVETIKKYLEETKKAKYIIVDSVEDLEDVARRQGLPDKIVSVPHSPITYESLTPLARANLADAVRMLLKEKEDLFIEFFRIAQPINVRLHAIETLRGVGKKTLRKFLQERDRGALQLSSYEDVKKHLKIDPVEALAEKILEELSCNEEVKYYLFVEPCDASKPFLGYLERMWKSYIERIRKKGGVEDARADEGGGASS